ncbi:tyrosine-protein phosphatase [Haloglycomyces albus]|uniref:tyrosine-protein phosphatase n=1 Tax=Haloglycomyces albus TaxID=526067 RepID=UPI00046D7F3D|nr:tyrosine-protein phosphatase [Haloglycomyces albus]
MPSSSLPEQFYPTSKVFNFRDVGGVETDDGGRLRKGVLLRSDNWMHATDDDLAVIRNDTKLRHIVDLRGPIERDKFGIFPATDDQTVHQLGLDHIWWQYFEDTAADPLVHGQRERFIAQRYASMLESGHHSIRQALEIIARGETTLIHCMAGKDRTGIVIALALALVGVSEEDISRDYCLSNIGLRRWQSFRNEKYGAPEVERGLECFPDVIPQTFALIRERFVSLATYADVIGFDRGEDLRKALVEY